MANRPIDETGNVYGQLTVLAHAGRKPNGHSTWLVRCQCGREYVKVGAELRRGHGVCCSVCAGFGERGSSGGHRRASGGRESPTYSSWEHMKKRCLNPQDKSYARYGGRGITVCEHWLTFANFLEDMGERPDWADGGIDRIDPDGNYEPGNCRWATREQQRENKRR